MNTAILQQAGQSQRAGAPTHKNRAEAMKAAQDFEAVFLRKIISDMRKNSQMLGDGLFGKSPGANIKESWYDNTLAEHMAQTGQVGLANALVEDWDRHGHIAKDSTAKANGVQARDASQKLVDFTKNLKNGRLLELGVQSRILDKLS